MANEEMIHLSEGTFLQGDKYKIVRFIGSGGFGCTYEGEHTMLQRRVAIKEFFVKDFCDRENSTSQVTVSTSGKRELVEKLRGKFVEKARATSRMQHPNIVKVYDVFEENGTAYYVMDYMEGPSLDKLVKENGPLPEQTAVKYIRQVADALEYVHSLNHLHLDLKPWNIMTDGHGNAVLVDFVASKQYDEAGVENTSTLIGKTPGYTPIEQMGNNVVTFTPATDIYALGATLYKLLTGVNPPDSTLLASGEELPPLPRNISESTANAVYAAMQVAKSKRPQSIAEFLSLLDPVGKSVTGVGTPATPTPPVPPTPVVSNPVEGETIIDSVSKKGDPQHSSQSQPNPEPPKGPKSKKGWKIAGIVLGAAAVIAGIVIFFALRTPTIKMVSVTGQSNGHDYVDLGLSVKWATCNVGASSPSGYGNYYAWGETATKAEYTSDNSATYGKQLGSIAGDPQYDAATANWGITWRMPTKEEIEELVNKCTWKCAEMDGHKGYEVTGPNGKSIFLPAAGWRSGSSLTYAGKLGHYWSATPLGANSGYAYSLDFYEGDFSRYCFYRDDGLSVRPVLSETSGTGQSQSSASSNSETVTSQGSNTQATNNSSPTSAQTSSLSKVTGKINGHEYVDLGLSVKWATCNVGASSPSGYGNYYAWGETKTKAEYTSDNSVTYGKQMGSIAGNPQYDAATANWGGTWRMPTKEEIEELVNKCTWKWTEMDGHKGYEVTGPNGRSIFLPAARWRGGSSFNLVSEHGHYWSATPYEHRTDYACYLSFYKSDFYWSWDFRDSGRSVRPVMDQSTTTSTTSQTGTQTSTPSSTQSGTITQTTTSSATNSTSGTSSSGGSTTFQQGSDGTDTQTTTSIPAKPTVPTVEKINGHEYVDLGLSVKWATCNVGASSPSGYGNYYAWGETATKGEYTESNSATYGKQLGSIAGVPQYDAATANWGGTWRMPTEEEIDELLNSCNWRWAEMDGHKGYEVTGPNGKSIFLPADGWRYGTSLYDAGDYGSYWSAAPNGGYTGLAYFLDLDEGSFDRDWSRRDYGRSVRPVSE